MKPLLTIVALLSISFATVLNAQNLYNYNLVEAKIFRVLDFQKKYPGEIFMTNGLSRTTNASWDDLTFAADGGFFFRMDYNKNGISGGKGFSILDSKNNYLFVVDEAHRFTGVNIEDPFATFQVNHDKYFGSDRNGLNIRNDYSKDDWTFHTSKYGDLQLYYETYFRGQFNERTGYYSSASDVRFKENIQDLEEGQMANIMQLNPTTYELNDVDDSETRRVYGLIAQELQQVYPDIVENTGAGPEEDRLAVSYTELIPILIKGMQEQQEQIAALQAQVKELQGNLDDDNTTIHSFKGVDLRQNAPNPADGWTTIEYNISREFNNGVLQITDVTGKVVDNINLGNQANGNVQLETDNLPAGTYNYSIILDGQLTGTKRMVIK